MLRGRLLVVRRYLLGLVMLVTAGCTSATDSVPTAPSETAVAADTTTESATSPAVGNEYVVPELGIRFLLPEEFEETSDPDYAFAARLRQPTAFFTIYAEPADITDFAPRPGETRTELDLGADRAIAIENAAVSGLPAGVSSHELLVSNGDRSFSVILSAPTSIIDELWRVFIGSISIEP